MTLNEVQSKSINEILQECDAIEQKIYTRNDTGVVELIELKFRPKDVPREIQIPSWVNGNK